MNTEQPNTQDPNARKGQTLAEFAITLPILLLLMFGIVEFGLIFQAWVSIENSARTAVRYASTGKYFEDRFDIDTLVPCDVATNLVGSQFVRSFPIINHPGGDTKRDVILYAPQGGAQSEHLFASWTGKPDCMPGDEDFQDRKDIMRLVSIYEEARRGASGLLLQNSPIDPSDPLSIENYLYSSFARPSPNSEERGWFDVVVCSSREKVFPDSETTIPDNTADPTGRFELEMDAPEYAPVGCTLEEVPGGTSTLPNNHHVPWLDAGGSGDRVTTCVTFNHPLITPLGLAPYLQLQSCRSAINEAFRVTNAERALGPTGVGTGTVATPTALPPTDPPTATPLPTDTPPATETFTPTFTATDQPFSCTNLYVENVTFSGERWFMDFRNENIEETTMTRSQIIWNRTPLDNAGYTSAYLWTMALESAVYWVGNDTISPTDTADPADGTFFDTVELLVPGQGGVSSWEGAFALGPNLLGNVMNQWDFSGTKFYFDHPLEPIDCEISLTTPTPPPPTDTPAVPITPSATFTPDCASSNLSVTFVSFDSFGDVRLRIENRMPATVAPFTGFSITWPDHIAGLGLKKVVAGGSNANDTGPGGGITVWSEASGLGVTTSPTAAGTSGSDGTWHTDYPFPPNSITFLHLDFTGAGASTLASLGVAASDFNGTWFDIWCGTNGNPFNGSGTGTGSTGGTGSGGRIFVVEEPTPTPTSPPQPTNTPGPTLTASKTPTVGPPTFTWTPRPTVPTNTPEPTSTNTTTPPPSDTPTPFDLGGPD